MSNAITITDCGPVPNLVIPVQPGGTIIRGYCGKGKSIVLEAIGLGLGARERGRVAPRAGTKRGEVDCLGVVLGINASRITRNGESSVASLEEFSVGDLIDPPVKDAEARNRHGIKALLRLSGGEAKPELFHHLAGGKASFEALVPPDSVKTTDLVDMAARVKRALESKAREAEGESEREEAKAAADRNAGDGLPMTACTDAAKLQRRLEEAAGMKAQLDEQARGARQAKQQAEAARVALASATGAGRSIAEYQAETDARKAEYAASRERVADLERALAVAKAESQSAFDRCAAAGDALEHARRTEAATAGWQAAIDAAADVYEPEASDLEMAARMVQEARKAIETAAVVRAAHERLARARQHQERAAESRKQAARLREAARATDDVLSAAVSSPRFAVAGDVLMGRLPTGEAKPFFDLSDGERTMIAVAEKIERARAVEPDGQRLALVDLPQRVFQDLPPSVRKSLFAMAAERNTCVVTAEVDDGDLRAEPWHTNGAAT